ncbi:MAG TPA: S-layer homology domain-containing protein [Chloroflexia bacterium]|nr:S-layer homology domain-containing protein [Chloroflexia bacterium]
MRPTSRSSLLVLALLALSLLAGAIADAQPAPGGRPPMLTPYPGGSTTPSTPVPAGPAPRPARPAGFPPVSLFGMNLYLTGYERSDSEARLLGTLAAQGGVQWSREELSWANIEPQTKGQFAWSIYDQRLSYDAANHLNVIGMLLTTPKWSSTNPTASDWYWYEPGNQNDYFDFVRAAVNRWKGQIHTWEIWNEPNATGTWNCVNSCDHAADYARLLQGAYVAVKSVDPSARVLIGGLYVHDYTNEGMAFLNQVVADSGGALNFDALSIHTYMPDRIPEGERPDSVVQNFQYRLTMVDDWITAHGGRPGEIWVTEDGRSTCVGCAYPWTEDEQANMLVRMYGIAAATPRVVQFAWFQFEDKFNNPNDLYGGMAIVREDYSTKPAYTAYQTAQRLLDGATYTGPGPQMIPGNNPNQPATSDWVGFDYRFTHNGSAFHLLWRPNDSLTLNYPVETAQVDVVDRDGSTTRLTANNGTVPLTLGPHPIYIVNVNCTARFSDVCPTYWAYTYIEFLAARGIVSGYGDNTFRPDSTATRAQLAKMIVVARGWPVTTPATPSFADVPASNPFYGYVETARAHGVISGYADGTFRPNNTVTRAQISKMVVTAFGWAINTTGGPHFADVPPTDPFYGYIETAYNHSIVSGYGTTFRPGNNVTRAQLSKMLYGAMNQ